VKSTIEELGPTRVRMAIEVPWGDLDHAFGEVYKELGKQVRVPGFRPGKVPNRVLDQRIGRPLVLEQVVQHAIPEVYSEVVRENQVRVLGQPDIEVTRLDDNDTLAFTAEVDVAPKLELPSLDELAVTVDDVEVTDADIDQQVDVMRERFSMLTGVERAAQDGDFVSIDLEATLDGEVLEDGTTSGMSYEVGSGSLMDGLDDAVRGLSADESATFSTALLAGPNAGQEAQVTVTVRSVKTKELPELDDDFASTASEFDTLEELRDDVRTRLARTKALQQGAQARDKLVEHLLETSRCPCGEPRRARDRVAQPAFEARAAAGRHGLGHASCQMPVSRRARPTTPSSARRRGGGAHAVHPRRDRRRPEFTSTTRTCRRRSWRRPSAAG
jgi:trigger factor